ncbi:MAG: hypothetical protein WKF84_04760 [Pyrinomonadaceae bacterium]
MRRPGRLYSSLNAMGEELISGLVAAGYAVIIKLHDRLARYAPPLLGVSIGQPY